MVRNTARLVYFERWLDPVAETILSARPEIDLVRLSYADPVADTAAAIRLAHGYQISPRTELNGPWFADAALLAQCPDLLAISSSGAGYDMVDVDACTAAGVIVCHQSGTNSAAVAEHALGLMLGLAKKIAQADKVMRRGGDLDRFGFGATDLHGKTLGIVGLGHIGSRLAQLCHGLLGMQILACDPYLDAGQITSRHAFKVDLDELLARSDFVSVHCPRSAETLGMFTLERFKKMKPTAYFINTARGGIHLEDDLADALAAGHLAGAGVDVFFTEPAASDHRLLAFENVIATPHIAGMTDGALRSMAAHAAEQWITILTGGIPPRLVNPPAWPAYAERFQAILGFAPASMGGRT